MSAVSTNNATRAGELTRGIPGETIDGNTLARWKLAASSFAKYHRERARFGGVAFEFHAMACTFMDGAVPDALNEVVRLRTELDAAVRKQAFVVDVDDSPRVVKLEAEIAALRVRNAELSGGAPRAVRALWERVQELEARLRALGIEED